MSTQRASVIEEIVICDDSDDDVTIIEDSDSSRHTSSHGIFGIVQNGLLDKDAVQETRINSSSNNLQISPVRENDTEDDDDDEQFYIAEDINHPDSSKVDQAISKSNIPLENGDLCMEMRLQENIENVEPRDNAMDTDQSGSDDGSDSLDGERNIVLKMPSEKVKLHRVLLHGSLRKRKTGSKRFIQMYCKGCRITRACLKIDPTWRICRMCNKPQHYQCRRCKNNFITYPAIVDHLKKYCQKDRFWNCPHCDSSFNTETMLENHIEKLHEDTDSDGPISCKNCDKKFASFGKKKNHSRVCRGIPDKGQNLFQCDVCSFCARFKHTLTKHKSSHIPPGERPICVPDITSSNVSNESREPDTKEERERLHNRTKLHCARCTLTFDNAKDFGKKCESCLGPLIYQCAKCNETSKSYCGIYDHVKNSCSSEEQECPKCRRKFQNEHDAIKHEHVCQQLVYLQCEVCSYKTKSKGAFKKHVKILHNMEVDAICKWM